MDTRIISVCDITPARPEMSNNGGDYFFGRTFIVTDGKVIAARHWTSADFYYCQQCGSFGCDGHEGDDRFYGSTEYSPDDAEFVKNPVGPFYKV